MNEEMAYLQNRDFFSFYFTIYLEYIGARNEPIEYMFRFIIAYDV